MVVGLKKGLATSAYQCDKPRVEQKKNRFNPTITRPYIITYIFVYRQEKMASYDSDSSDGEFEETNILLGYASKEAEEGEDTVSHLGGHPVRLSNSTPNPATYKIPTGAKRMFD